MSLAALFSYSQASGGAKELAEALGINRLRHKGGKFVGSRNKVVLNWGATPDKIPENVASCTFINNPVNVQYAVNKDVTFQKFQEAGVAHPEWTTSNEEAQRMLGRGHMVFARTQLRAHSGRGIVILDPEFSDNWNTRAPLYVKYIPKKDEYRIHIFRGQVIDVQRKGLKEELQGTEGVNFKIRNLANGFVYTRNDANGVSLINSNHVPNIAKDVAIAAVAALGLDFGAADIIYNERQNRAYCLEVNTAPGLMGTTVTNYANAMRGL